MTDTNHRASTCSKSELAQLYLPNVSPAAARRTLSTWIEKNPKLKAALLETGYSDEAVLLTPLQVQLHFKYLGEP